MKLPTIKFLKNKIVLINGNKYIPHHLHQTPKNYEEIPLSSQFNHKGFVYICSNEINWSDEKEARYTNNLKLGGLATR